MPRLVISFLFFLIFTSIAGISIWALLGEKPKKKIEEGTWRRIQETIPASRSSLIRIYLIREYKGSETGRLFVAEIDSSDENWASKYTDAIAEAENRIAALAVGEGK